MGAPVVHGAPELFVPGSLPPDPNDARGRVVAARARAEVFDLSLGRAGLARRGPIRVRQWLRSAREPEDTRELWAHRQHVGRPVSNRGAPHAQYLLLWQHGRRWLSARRASKP